LLLRRRRRKKLVVRNIIPDLSAPYLTPALSLPYAKTMINPMIEKVHFLALKRHVFDNQKSEP
jgi:hypothetical protein